MIVRTAGSGTMYFDPPHFALAEASFFVEGNSSPDLDMHQPLRRRGLRQSHVATLLAHHLAARV